MLYLCLMFSSFLRRSSQNIVHYADHVRRFDDNRIVGAPRVGRVIENAFMATKLAIGVLGNGFSGRLMKEVRDKDGLTYGIYAKQPRLYGAHTFEVTATFAPSLLERGLSETARVMKEWKEGITDEEIDVQKQILLGSQSVHWDNPAAISATIHSTLLQDKPLDVIDRFKQKIKDITYQQVRTALKEQLHVDRLKRVVVGTF